MKMELKGALKNYLFTPLENRFGLELKLINMVGRKETLVFALSK